MADKSLRHKKLSMKVKNDILYLRDDGWTCRKIAIEVGYHYSTVSRVIKAYEEGKGLVRKKPPGRPRKTTKRDDAILTKMSAYAPELSSITILRIASKELSKRVSDRLVRRRIAGINK